MMRPLLLLLAPLVLLACPNTATFRPRLVSTQSEGGALNVAITQIAPWDEYVASLTPNFTLTADGALEKVIPTTTLMEEKLVDTLVGSLRVGLPTSGTTTTTTANSGAAATTSNSSNTSNLVTSTTNSATDGTNNSASVQRVTTEAPGQLPTATNPTLETPSALPGIPESGRQLSDEPVIQYQNAVSLFQEVRLLNRYVADAALRSEMVPYIVRLQIQVLPYARHQPYDVFATFSFFTCSMNARADSGRCLKEAPRPPLVLPLIATDNLESTARSRSTELIRQLTTAISFMQSGVVAELGLARGWRQLNSVLGSDLNGLFAVGRVTDNSIAVRLGAARQATAGYAMVPRTHNVTVLVMAPTEWVETTSNKRTIRVVGHWNLRHAESGQTVPRGTPREYAALDVLREYFPRQVRNQPHASHAKLRKVAHDLFDSVFLNNYKSFHTTLKRELLDTLGPEEPQPHSRDVWVSMVEALESSHIVAARAELPSFAQAEPPIPNQTVFITDDGKRGSATLIGGRGIVASELRGHLDIQLRGGARRILPVETASTGPGGSTATVVFPSISAWRIGPLEQDGLELSGSRLVLRCCVSRWGSSDGERDWKYDHVMYRRGEVDSAVASLRQQSKNFSVKDAGTTVRVWIEFAKLNNQNIASSVELAVSGAELVSPAINAKGVIVATADGYIDLGLRNPEPEVRVTAVPKDATGGIAGALPEALVFKKAQ